MYPFNLSSLAHLQMGNYRVLRSNSIYSLVKKRTFVVYIRRRNCKLLAKKNQHGAIIIHMDSWWGRRCVYPDQLLFLLNAKNLLFVLVWRRHLFGLLRSLSVLLFPVIICFCIFIFGFVSISDHCKSFYKQNMLIYNALTMPSSHISGDWGCMHSFFSAKCAKKFGW